jgi:hypothetical protein
MRSVSYSSKQLWTVPGFVVLAMTILACRGNDRAGEGSDTVQSTITVVAPLDSAARQVVAFLRGEAPFSSIELADTVALYLGKEGGGTRKAMARAQLRRPSSWSIQSRAGTFSFAPPHTHTRLSTKPGAHFICTERQLASSFPQLASLPHVGTMLEPEKRDSCLQTWNVTFVFDDRDRPRLVAAVYDQWEW